MFVDDARVPRMVNLAVQASRPLVVLSKITFGHRTRKGSERMVMLMTVANMAHRHGHLVSQIFWHSRCTHQTKCCINCAPTLEIECEPRTGFAESIGTDAGVETPSFRNSFSSQWKNRRSNTDRRPLRIHLADPGFVRVSSSKSTTERDLEIKSPSDLRGGLNVYRSLPFSYWTYHRFLACD